MISWPPPFAWKRPAAENGACPPNRTPFAASCFRHYRPRSASAIMAVLYFFFWKSLLWWSFFVFLPSESVSFFALFVRVPSFERREPRRSVAYFLLVFFHPPLWRRRRRGPCCSVPFPLFGSSFLAIAVINHHNWFHLNNRHYFLFVLPRESCCCVPFFYSVNHSSWLLWNWPSVFVATAAPPLTRIVLCSVVFLCAPSSLATAAISNHFWRLWNVGRGFVPTFQLVDPLVSSGPNIFDEDPALVCRF